MLVSSNAMGDVSLFDGAYRRTDTDTGGITRHYSSRKLERGIFGTGWCHPLENRLQLRARGPILHDCRSPLPIEYGVFREGRTEATHDKTDRLIRKGSLWERQLGGRTIETYDESGKLRSYLDGAKIWTVSSQRDGRLRLTAATGEITLLDLDASTGLVRWVQSPQGRRLFYQYQQGFLRGTKAASGKTFEYVLSSTGDIVQAKDGSAATEIVVYDEELDRVLRVERTGGCALEISYQMTRSGGGPATASARKRCPVQLARQQTEKNSGE